MTCILPSNYTDYLPATEALARYADGTDKQLDQYRLDDHESFKDFERRKGEVLHSSRFIHRLLQLEPRLVIQQQINYPDDWGLYTQTANKLIFICQVSKGWLTEWSYTTVDSQNLPSIPKWGWRTVLIRLMTKGVLTWEQVLKEFGDPNNANAYRWRQQTAPFRVSHASSVIHNNVKSHYE